MSTTETTQTNVTNVRYKKSFAPTDYSIPFRLVGTYEYGKSVEHFNRLLAQSSPEELEVYDRILNNRPEFTYFNGVNSAFAGKEAEVANLDRKKFTDQFMKKGVSWMCALAKIELAATVSLYGQPERPFETMPISAVERKPYIEVLRDDVVAHMKSLATEAAFKEVLRPGRKAGSLTLAYLRRIKLIKDMLRTLHQTGDPLVKSQIAPLSKELSYHEKKLVKKVIKETVQYVNSEKGSSTTQKTTRKTIGIVSGTRRQSLRQCDAFVRARLGGSGGTGGSGGSSGSTGGQ